MGIEVGYGAEGFLTDSESGRIGREVIVPYFQDGDYYFGLFVAMATVAEELGYNVSDIDTSYDLYGFEDPDIIDILLEGDPSLILWWLLGTGGDIAIVIVLIIVIFILFGGSGRIGRGWSGGRSGGGRGGRGGGGRSGGGGSKGRW